MTSHPANYPNQPASSEEMLGALQRDAFGYFLHETNPANDLVADKATGRGRDADDVNAFARTDIMRRMSVVWQCKLGTPLDGHGED